MNRPPVGEDGRGRLLRIWRTTVDPGQGEAYDRFARELSLPMFRRQQGFLGVVFLRRGAQAVVVTLWEDTDAVEALATSQSYLATVRAIRAEGFLTGSDEVEVWPVVDHHLAAAAAWPPRAD